MNDKQLELTKFLFTRGAYDARRARGGVPSWLHECEGTCVSEKVWLHFHKRPMCQNCGAKTKFVNYNTGYRQTCCCKCAQQLLELEKRSRHEALWSNKKWKEETSTKMKMAHYENRAQKKLDELAKRGINPIDKIAPGMNNKYKWSHTCGEVFERSFARVSGIWCPSCHVSKGQGELYEAIRERYSGEILVNDRKVIRPLEIDIYIPEMNLGFEYHGVYWHPGDGTREHNKVLAASAVGLQIEEFWELLWKHKRQVQLTRLDDLFGTLRQTKS